MPHPCEIPDPLLLRDCRIDTYRASGPGGQKRNNTSSAVRITHLPSAIQATAADSRSQPENRARALRRLRLQLALEIRSPITSLPPWWPQAIPHGKFSLASRNPLFPSAIAIVLDALDASHASLHDAATLLGLSTSQLAALLASHPHVWAKAQQLRQSHGQHPLLNPRKS